MVGVLVSSVVDHIFKSGSVKSRTIKMVFTAFLLSMQN